MRRLVTFLLAASMLVLPSAALAQSAGDEQYADPFGQVEEPNGSQEEPAQAPEATPEAAPAPAPAPAEPTASGEEAVVSQQADSPTLPVTGLPAGLLAGTGALLLAAGTTLRRRASLRWRPSRSTRAPRFDARSAVSSAGHASYRACCRSCARAATP
jgi:hypothetical protein